jgi:hypothetical protein
VESRLPGHASIRDLVRELIDALHAYGIKVQFYLHATIGDTFTEEQRAATGWYDATDHYRAWNDFINRFFDEFTARYRSDLDSIYIDMITYDEYLDRIDKPRLRRTILANCPGIPIVGNGNAEEVVDYGSREDGAFRILEVDDRQSYAQQSVVCLAFYWWASAPETARPQPYYTPEHLFRYMVLTAGTNAAGGGLAIGASPYATGGWEPGVLETFLGVRKLLDPIRESILDTYPSTSYITPGGAAIPSLENGITATRSPDDAFEYLHVLVPPVRNSDDLARTLDLPLPLDGRTFSDATMLRSGHLAHLVQDGSGVHLTIPDAWDPLDTVIRLTVSHRPEWPAGSRLLPLSGIRASASNCAEGHPADHAVDGNDATYWATDTSVPNWIQLDFGETHRVNRVDYRPRQDGSTGAVRKTAINAYNIKVSEDGVHFITVAQGEWKVTGEDRTVRFPPVKARYVRLEAPIGYIYMFGEGRVAASEVRIGVYSNRRKVTE